MSDRRRAYEPGGGDPWGEEFEIWPGFGPGQKGSIEWLLGTGGGDDLDGSLETGGGDPWLLGVDIDVQIQVSDWDIDSSSDLYSPSRYTDPEQYSQEGGWIIRLTAPGSIFPDGEYRVDLVSGSSQIYPAHKPGCNSALFGQAQRCLATEGRRVLTFAVAAAPVGEYSVQITFPDGMLVTAASTIQLTYVPDSPHFHSVIKLPAKVYKPKNPIKRY